MDLKDELENDIEAVSDPEKWDFQAKLNEERLSYCHNIPQKASKQQCIYTSKKGNAFIHLSFKCKLTTFISALIQALNSI